MKIFLFLFTLGCSFSPAAFAARSDVVIEPRNEGKPGEIRYSILREKQFQSLYGKAWQLMAGQSVAETDALYRLGWKRIPDVQGPKDLTANVFIKVDEPTPQAQPVQDKEVNSLIENFEKNPEFKKLIKKIVMDFTEGE